MTNALIITDTDAYVAIKLQRFKSTFVIINSSRLCRYAQLDSHRRFAEYCTFDVGRGAGPSVNGLNLDQYACPIVTIKFHAATLSISNAKLEAGRLLECGGANQVVHVLSYCGNVGSTVLPWKIGPSALVTAQSCSFSGPVAELSGLPGRNAVLIIQNSLLAKPASQSIIYKNAHAYAAVEGVFIQWSNTPA